MSLVLLAVALLVVPSARARRRLAGTRRRWEPPKPNRAVAVVVGIALGALVGVGGAMAGGLLAATVWRTYRETTRQRDRLAASVALADGVQAFVAELRSGAHPAKAAMGAAEDAQRPATDVLRAIAATSSRGGDVEAALADFPDAHQLARAWRLSAVHGVPLADVVDAVRRDLDRRVAFAGQVHARMAGPRAGAAVLAGLPLFGVVLGELGGAGPLAVLSGTPPGQVLLVVGVVLICAGLRWSGRLTRQVIA
ncbi:tight adherence protein B [Saccharothrix saharensis]|uniref:Tight adherence protein B n=1 Tax=Saccharothrix saharensis TaxID=571190 RepID=A0A543JFL3_9PSEU|nr:type II secretion system F family protein [Saccharothrix saharensis]TQM81629.1 tight adherence protein B [Saccharothrix saharensis]